ncbi:MAG: IPT/TIG domain-containing protein, partial [Dehalococcoidia bacterium]
VRVSGSGVGPRDRISVTVGDRLVRVEAVASNQGVWSADVTIPQAPRSSLAIRAAGLNTQEAVTSFDVTSTATISEQTATPGTTITVKGEGFGANQSSISVNFNDSIVASAVASAQGSWVSKFTVPSAPKGTYTVYIVGGSSELEVQLSVTPALQLTQSQARPGESNSVSGTGFGANERDIKITLNNTILASGINANADGSWNTNFLVPVLPSGSYQLTASGSQTSVASVREEILTLGLDLSLSVSAGPPGTTATISGRGFRANEGDISVLFDGTPVLTGIVADNLGAFSASFEVPASAAGRHSVEIARSAGTPGVATNVAFQVSPQIHVANPKGTPGAKISVVGSGFAVNEKKIALFYDNQKLPETVNADSAGSFNVAFSLPESPTGSHTIRAVGPASAAANRPQQSVEVVPTVELSDSTGAVGLELEIIGKGFGPGVLVNIAYGKQTEQSVVTEASGSFRAVVTVPKSGHGEHLLQISDEIGNRKQMVFTVEDIPPPAPVLLFPRNGDKGGLFGGYRPVPRWSGVDDPSGVSYALIVARDPDFFDVVLEKSGLTRPSYPLTELEALPRGKYHWKVAATDEAGNVGPWSDTFTMHSGIIPVWVIPAAVALGILAASSTGYTFVYRPWRQRQLSGMPDFVRISRPDTGAAAPLGAAPPPSRTLAAPPRRALPSPFRRGRGMSPEDQARLQLVVDFMQSLPLIEVSADLTWLEELVEELGGIKEEMYELVLMGQVDLAYQPAWMQHPTYEELQQTPQAREFLQSLDEYVNAVSECAVDTVAHLRQIYGSLLTSNPPEALDDSQWRLVLTVAVGTISWFRGTFLAQPSPRDYMVRPASDSPEEVLYSLHGGERTPFAFPLVEGLSESEATFYRDLHIQLRNFYRSSDEVRLLAAKMASTDALRGQLLQSIALMGQNVGGR